jgi:hypothetical protein
MLVPWGGFGVEMSVERLFRIERCTKMTMERSAPAFCAVQVIDPMGLFFPIRK